MSTSGDSESFPRPSSTLRTRIWGSEIPYRNSHFTGRENELHLLREQLTAGGAAIIRQPPSTLYGLGGVGKTQLATEYAHRFADDYEVIWWIRSDQEDNIQATLVALGVRLQLEGVSQADRDRSLPLVLNALESGMPYSRWLIIFDDVTNPSMLRRYVPRGGHVIVTSRITEWRQVLNTDGIEVREFARDDTIRFLRERVSQLALTADPAAEAVAETDANRLAEVLGDLPLAAEHAAAYLTQTGTSVTEYIAAFQRDAYELLTQDADMIGTSTNQVVATTWGVTRHKLSPEAQDPFQLSTGAQELFQLLVFFAAEPIAEEILQPGNATFNPELPPTLRKVLSSRNDLRRAERALARFSLITVYGQRNVAQLHRVVQAVIRARIERENPSLATTLQEAVYTLLAATDPESPEREQNDPIYERTIGHLIPTGALNSQNRNLRDLIINQVRRLRLRGANQEALGLGEPALKAWQSQPDDIQTLALAIEVAWIRRVIGRIEEAFALNTDTLDRLRTNYDEENDTYLICANNYSADLRTLGKYEDAYNNDRKLVPAYDYVFGPETFRPLSIRNNLAIDMRCTGRNTEALALDTEVFSARLGYFGPTDLTVVNSKFGIARDLRQLGRYEEALQTCREISDILRARDEPWNFLRLSSYAGLSVSLRRAGYYPEARDIAEDVYHRYLEYAGPEHRETLVAATTLMCDRMMTDDLIQAQELGESTVASWTRLVGESHPCTLSARANLALILRVRGFPAAALERNQATLAEFRSLYPYDHPDTLTVMTNLASDLAAVGESQQAREVGEELLAKSRAARGDEHPATLAAAANLALDLRATGDRDGAAELHAQTLTVLDEQFPEHPSTLRARQQGRISLDIEPMYT